MKFKKLVLYDLKSAPLEKEFLEKLKEFADSVEIVFAEKEYAGGLKLSDIRGADALVTRIFDNYDNSMFEKSSLRYIGAMHTDVSHFNAMILGKNGIALTNVPGYATEAVAELTISALLNISRRTHDAMNFVKRGNWGFESFMGRELKGKTLGIIGLGRIGTRVAEIAEGLGMKIVHYTPSKKSDKDFLELDELLKQSDVVSLHCSLNGETEGILNSSKLKLMKKGSLLLNSARSELVDLEAAYKICKRKRIFAWFEAIEQEEIRDRFNKLDNVYLTPHFGWMTREAQQELRDITLNNIKSYLEGKTSNRIQ
ncbi:MAG: 2-hydroxyacid dehydrogenase, partial [Candidatus Micrarchaeota archaeon]|nr:2-hydroxyacid dehydrogenase [Candidatus Micrarchaeota archaeon]